MSEAEAVAAHAITCVPDMISNILERVPDPASVFRCSLVCKEWRRIVSDPAWHRRRGESQSTSASLVGIFVQHDRPRKITELFPTTAPVLIPAPESVLGPQLRFLTCFIRDDDGVLDDAHPLAARDGLLLVRVWRPPRSTNKSISGGGGGGVLMHLCVCNLLTGSRDLLPALDVDEAAVKGYALLTAADHGARARTPTEGYSTLFQVLLLVRLRRGRDEQLRLGRFSSASGDWDAIDCSQQNLGIGTWGPYGCLVATVARGTAHWLFHDCKPHRFYTLDVSGSTGQVSSTALPIPADTVRAMIWEAHWYRPWWLCTTAEGRLALLCLKSNNRLAMMKQRDDDDDDDGCHHWESSHVAEVHVDVDLGFGRESLSPVCIGDRSGTLLARSRSDPERRAYVLDLDLQSASAGAGSATPSKAEGWIRTFNFTTAAPFEINWATFFASRLGELFLMQFAIASSSQTILSLANMLLRCDVRGK